MKIRESPPPIAPRLTLRRPTSDDAPEVAGLLGDGSVMRFLGGAVPPDRAVRRLQNDLDHWRRHGYGLLVLEAAVRMGDDGAERQVFAGLAGLQIFEGDPDLSYVIAPPLWGQGLGTEAAVACLKWAFGPLGLPLVRAVVHRRHTVSQRVLDKAGMRYMSDRSMWGQPHMRYAVTAYEWPARVGLLAPATKPISILRAAPDPGAAPLRTPQPR
ncbi:MAG: GNAT family N-acetyltransferase [Streptosporangiales bacterium]|nr:GNAT family N-acetyltransferase [Streptosporangiales bacterium]